METNQTNPISAQHTPTLSNEQLTRKQMDFEARVAASGARAFNAGIPRRNCPLHEGSAARTYWERGYDKAKRAWATGSAT